MVLKEMEKKVLDSIDRDEVIDLELKMVSIPSFTTEEAELARFLYNYMKGFGLNVELEEVLLEGKRPDIDRDFTGKSTYIPIGRIKGSGEGSSLLFFGHMDTSPVAGSEYWDPSGWKRDPFKPVVEEPFIYGKGCQDEKGGICAFITAAKAMVRAGFKPKGDIYFCPVPGHKRVSFGTRHLLENYGLHTDYAINSENSGMGIVPVNVGRSEGSIHIKAPPFHFSHKERNPELVNRKTVIENLRIVLEALGPEMMIPHKDSWMTFEVTKGLENYPQIRIENIKLHVPPAARTPTAPECHVQLSLQIRTVPGQTDEVIAADLWNLIKKLELKDPYFKAEVNWPDWPSRPAINTPLESPLIKSLASAYQDLVTDPPLDVSSRGRIGGSGDGSLTFGAGIPTAFFGPGGGARAKLYEEKNYPRTDKDERVLIDDIVNCSKVMAIAAMRLCG
jgi:acetylornithine deacetylase